MSTIVVIDPEENGISFRKAVMGGQANMDTPPGLKYMNLTYLTSGGDENEWIPFTKVKYYTNAFIVKDNQVLLGYKKRGFGMGKYNGFGGKVQPGETPLNAAIRELEEEAGITAPLEHAGSLLFLSEDAEWAFEIEIYRADTYEGTIEESEEMRPEWFSLPSSSVLEAVEGNTPTQYHSIPFSQMWETDYIWLPLVIRKQKFVGRADFRMSGDILVPYKWWYALAPNDP